jgi:poly(3-hydroxybutyrate) depolymerase
MRMLVALMFCVAAGAASAATPVPGGRWSFVFTDAKGQRDKPIRVYTYRPKACDSKCPIQFVLHGMSRGASRARDNWVDIADRHNILIIAPEFSAKDWPGNEKYNLGDVAGNENPERWAYSAIEHLFDEMRDGQNDYNIFGHSAGAQFVHRMLLLLPGSRGKVYAAANAGWYAMPEWRKEKTEAPYPHTLVGSKSGEAQVRQALAKRLIVLVGENDNDPDHEALDKSAASEKQGATRVARGEKFVAEGKRVAAELGITTPWELIVVPGTAHNALPMGNAASVAIYGKP